jgi:tRNA1Val (adenine37-N6)-methyltransferase
MKAAKPFVFKQFTVEQDKCALKVNTDAVLLGALAEKNDPANILDIGAGTGVISLMLAQRFPKAIIHSVEIEPNAFLQAQQNFNDGPWADRMEIFHLPFQELHQTHGYKYDLIVSNPPYYTDHLKTRHQERNIALHGLSLTFEELAAGVREALSEQGTFYAILPERQMEQLVQCFQKLGMYAGTKVNVLDRPGAPILRVIRAFGSSPPTTSVDKEIIIKDAARNYSSDYASLLKDFLLIF